MDKAQILDYALLTLGAGAVAILGAGLRYAATWIAAHTQNKVDDVVLPKLASFADLAVKTTFQAYVKPLQETGRWTPESHSAAQTMAVQELKSYLGEKGLRSVAQAAGGDVERLLIAMVDSAVHDNKRSGAIAAGIAAAADRAPRPALPAPSSGDREPPAPPAPPSTP